MASTFQVPPDIAQIAGPLVVGYLLHWGLFGALSVQIYLYYLAFPTDPRSTQVLVYGVYAVELAQTIMFTHSAFKAFAEGFGNMNALASTGVIWFSAPIMSSSVALVVQIFYAYRIKILSRSNIVASIIFALAIIQWGGGIATGVQGKVHDFSSFLSSATYITLGFWNGGAALCDVVIAVAMTYYLSKMNSSWKRTHRLVQKLIRLVVETGTITATIAIANLILSLLPSKPTYYQATSATLGKMYSNTMMAVFNSRIILGRNEKSDVDDSGYVSSERAQAASRASQAALGQRGIVVTRTQVNDSYNIPLDTWNAKSKKDLEG